MVCVFVALLMPLAFPANAGTYEEGKAAEQRGDFLTALEIYRTLAEQGHAKSQNRLGLMHLKGRGAEPTKLCRLRY